MGKSARATGGLAVAVTEFIQKTYPLALLQWLGKTTVVLLFVIYTVLSAWGVSRLEESFQLESVIPPESYYSKHLQVGSRVCHWRSAKLSASTLSLRRGLVVGGVRPMNEVNARRTRLVPGWMTVFGRVYHLGM